MLIWICYSLVRSLEYGFFSIPLPPKGKIDIDSTRGTVFLIDLNTESVILTFKNNSATGETEVPLYSSQSINIVKKNVIIKSLSLKKINIRGWYLPTEMCLVPNYIISAQRNLNIHAKSENFGHDTCIFSQTKARFFDFSYNITPNISNTSILLYDPRDIYTPLIKCQKQLTCNYKSKNPFFLRIKSNSSHSFELDALYKVSHVTSYTPCGVYAIPKMSPYGKVITPKSIYDVYTLCGSLADDILYISSIAVVIIVMLLLIISILHITGAVDFHSLCCPNESKFRFNILKKDPFVPSIPQTENEA